jgi:hypothetical protein
VTAPYQRTEAPAAQRPSEPYPIDPRTATRHLCAGAYIDESFRNQALREVYYQSKRLIAPSFGFDAVPVLAHCVRARNGAIIRDSAILLTVLILLFISPTALVFTLAGMASLQVTVATYRLARDCIRKLRNNEPMPIGTLLARVLLLVFGYALATLVYVFAVALLAGNASDSFEQGGTSGATSAITGASAGALLLYVLFFAYSLGFSLWRQSQLSAMMPGSQVTQPVHNQRLEEVARQQRGNTTVYSGFKSYVGSGDVLHTWGFAVRVVRADDPSRRLDAVLGAGVTEQQREFDQLPFTAQELVDFVRERLSTLLPERAAEEQIAGLTVEDRVCLAGTEVSQLLPWIRPEVMAAVVRHPTSPARHYLACQVFAWGGQLIPTVYVHVAVQGRSLYLELTTTVLPPCDERYRVIDTVEGHSAIAWWRAIGSGLAEAPRAIWRSPVNLAGALINLVAGSSTRIGSDTRLTRGYDYGAKVGVRELGSDPDVRFLTQWQDVAKYKKLIERRVIASVLDYLDDRRVDTTEFRSRAASVLNISGGTFARGETVTFNGPVAGGNQANGGAES